MKKNYNIIKLFLIISFSFFACLLKTFALSTDVNSWDELNTAITSKNYDEIHIINSESWIANKTITIDNQNITIIAGKDIIISRDAEFTGSFFDIKNSSKVIIGNTANKIIFDGVLIPNSKSLININSSNLNLNKVTIENNIADSNGGAFLAVKAKLEISNSTFDNNKGKYGGAIHTDSNCITNIDNSKIINNESITGSGGGLYGYGTITISESTVSNNTAYTYGGGLMIKSTATITNTTISNNTAKNNSGGGIKIDGNLTMDGGQIFGNKSGDQGAGVNYTAGYFTYKNVTFTDNMILSSVTVSNSFPDASSPNNIDWTKNDSLNLQEIKSTTKLKNFKRSTSGELKNTGALQGLTLTDKFIVFAQWTNNDSNTYLQVIDKSTLKVVNTISNYNFGHANDLAYDPNTGFIYIHSGQTNNAGQATAAKFKLDSNGKVTDYSLIEAPIVASGIAYDSENNHFLYFSGEKIYIYDADNKLVSSFSSPTKLTTQGIGFYKGYVYFSCYEAGYPTTYQTVFNVNEKHSNIIYMYNLSGRLVKTLYLPYTLINGEIESISFYDNGELLLGYNKDGITFYKTDFPIAIKGISISKAPNKTHYSLNSTFDPSGMVIGLTYNNETTSDMNYDSKTVSIEGFDSTKLGKQSITVKYLQYSTKLDIEIVSGSVFKLPNIKVDSSKKIIKNIALNTKVKDLYATTENNDNLEIYASNGTLLYSKTKTNNDAVIATGYYVTYYEANGDKVTYKLSVSGDPSGDGKINSLDYVRIKNHIMGSKTIEGNEFIEAADYNNDNKISSLDYVKIKNYIMSNN